MFFRRPIKFGELVNKVYRSKRGVNPHLSFFGEKRLNRIDSLMISEYQTFRLKSVKPASVNRELSVLKKCFSQAVIWGMLDKNPCTGIKMLKESPRTRYLSPQEESLILSHSPEWLRNIVSLDLQTGLRLSEILSLTWGNVNLTDKTLCVVKSKNGEVRTLPLNAVACGLLGQLSRVEGRLFPYSPSFVSHSFRRVCDRLGLRDIVFHSLRHTFGSRLAQQNVNVFAIQKLMGHKVLAMTERYSHLNLQSLRAPVEQLSFVN